MPDEYTGGIGTDGVTNLRKFVEDGGTLVFLNRASDFAIEQFNLPIKDVTKGLNRKDFFIPGSILRTELDTEHPIAKGMPKDSIAWFENSPAFEITISDDTNVEIIARYPIRRKIFCFRAGRWGGKDCGESRACFSQYRKRKNRFVRLQTAISRSEFGDISVVF